MKTKNQFWLWLALVTGALLFIYFQSGRQYTGHPEKKYKSQANTIEGFSYSHCGSEGCFQLKSNFVKQGQLNAGILFAKKGTLLLDGHSYTLKNVSLNEKLKLISGITEDSNQELLFDITDFSRKLF